MAYYDDETQAAAASGAGAAAARVHRPARRPAVSTAEPTPRSSANRLRDYVARSGGAHPRALIPPAKFEVLFPFDVNHPTPAGVHLIGGRLNRFVNLPAEWERKATSGLDRLKIEALDFGAWSRDLELSRAAVFFGISLDWPKDSLRHLLAGFPTRLCLAEGMPDGAGRGGAGSQPLGVRPRLSLRDRPRSRAWPRIIQAFLADGDFGLGGAKPLRSASGGARLRRRRVPGG